MMTHWHYNKSKLGYHVGHMITDELIDNFLQKLYWCYLLIVGECLEGHFLISS